MSINDLLRSSIIGKDFVNYRKQTDSQDRCLFGTNIRSKGLGQIPIVVDSVDKELSLLLAQRQSHNIKYGLELILHMDLLVKDVVQVIYNELKKKDPTFNSNINIGLEDGSIPEFDITIGLIYKIHKNTDDNILYLLVTRETSIYQYLLSIINYLYSQMISKYF